MNEASGEFTIINRLGLHARAAAKLVQLASSYPCEIVASREGQSANAKSVMGVLLLCGAKGTRLKLEAKGPRAEEAVEALGALIGQGFGEDDDGSPT